MFHPYCAWGGEFLGLASLWSTDKRWLGSWQPLRQVTLFVAPSTLAKERLPCRASAYLYPKYIPGLNLILTTKIILKFFWKSCKIFIQFPPKYFKWFLKIFSQIFQIFQLYTKIFLSLLNFMKFVQFVSLKYLNFFKKSFYLIYYKIFRNFI